MAESSMIRYNKAMEVAMYKYFANDFINSNENICIIKYVMKESEEEHIHDFIELEYISNGSGIQIINGESFSVERGDLLFLNFGDRHSIHPLDELCIINILLKSEFLDKKLVDDQEKALDLLGLASFKEFNGLLTSILPKVKFSGKELVKVETTINFMLQEFNEKSNGYIAIQSGYVTVLLSLMLRAVKENDNAGIYSEIKKITPDIIRYIEQNYNEKISVKELARKSFYNPSYFSHLFKECFGKNLTDYLHEKRIQEAMKMLKETRDSIESICQAGYNDKKRFYNLFKSYTGITPNQFRNNKKSLQEYK